MSVIKLSFATNFKFSVTFEGEIEQYGDIGYKFSGTLEVEAYQYRGGESFENTARFGHGSSRNDWKYLDFIVGDKYEPRFSRSEDGQPTLIDENGEEKILEMSEYIALLESASGRKTFQVEGIGKRVQNDSVDFRLGFNDGLNGEFSYGDTTTLAPLGAPQTIKALHISRDGVGNVAYDVRLSEGTIRANNSTSFIIEGNLDATGPSGILKKYAAFGYKTSSGSWKYEICAIDDTPKKIKINGSRKAGESVQIILGATTKPLNFYSYGTEVNYELPGDF